MLYPSLQIIISSPLDSVVGQDTAHCKVLCKPTNCPSASLSQSFLAAISCLAQQRTDLSYHVLWRWYFTRGADLLICA